MQKYSLSCKDMGVEKCDYIAEGETKEEVIDMATQHGMKVHAKEMEGMMEKMSKEEINEKMMDNIKETDV